MASSAFCEYCGAIVRSDQQECPACGAPNPVYVPESTAGKAKTVHDPRTIAELQAFCAERGMPLQRMRFFIGQDERSPRAFGIYQDGGDFIVYKNKSDGSRAIRYQGPDEAFAVKELYDKLKEEHAKRSGSSAVRSSPGSRSGTYRSSSPSRGKKRSPMLPFFIILGAIILLYIAINTAGHWKDGYYRYHDDLYYRYGSSWYQDDGYGDWMETYYFPADDYSEYYEGGSYDDSWGASDFRDSWYWEDLHSSNSDWDYDDYDYDSWDSGDTDWDSDW